MAPSSNNTLHQNHCTICLEGLALRTTVTLRCRHTFHLDCLGSTFNAVNEMRCPICRAVEEGVWRTFPTGAQRSSRAGAHLAQEGVQVPPVRMQPESGIYWSLDQGWFSGSLSHGNGGPIRHPHLFQRRHRETAHMMTGSVNGSGRASASSHVTRITHLRLGVNRRPNYGYSFQGGVGSNEHYHPFPRGMNNVQPVGLEAPGASLGSPFSITENYYWRLLGRLAGPAPMQHSTNLPSPLVRTMMRAANNRSISSGLLPDEQMAFQAEGSGMVNIQLPNVEVVVALSADVQPRDGMDGPEDIMSDGEESIEDLLV